VSADVAERTTAAGPARRRRRRWLALGAAVLVVACLVGLWSTHATLSGGSVNWSASVPGKALGLKPATGAELKTIGELGDYSQVLWASRPGGEITFGFELHNGGIVPITVLGLRPFDPNPLSIHDLAPVSALLGPDKFGRLTRFHPVSLGPGDSVAVGLTERVVCDPTVRKDVIIMRNEHQSDTAWLAGSTSPVVVHYRVLGLPASQTISLGSPLLVAMPYGACG
jgi:hypothetical protein